MPRQLVDDGLASTNKAEATYLVKASSKPTSLAFLVGTAVPPRRLRFFWGDEREMGPGEITCKNKFLLHSASKYGFRNIFSMDVLRNESKKDGFANHLKCNWVRNPS
jgi:hypothetical protein